MSKTAGKKKHTILIVLAILLAVLATGALILMTHTSSLGGGEPFSCFDFDGDSGLEADGEMAFENRDFRDQAFFIYRKKFNGYNKHDIQLSC